jgi:very-short-patch-repair endonuclease
MPEKSKANTLRRREFKTAFAKDMRQQPTDAERKLWWLLRNKQMAQLRFRRQQPIGPYIADFFCPSAKLIVELDGGQHGTEENRLYDEQRTRFLNTRGYRVLRFGNEHFLKHPDSVLEGIWHAVNESAGPLPEALRASTLPQGEGG